MDKIFVHKNETAREIVDAVLASEADEISLVIPRNAGLKDSVSNFHFIKRELARSEKTVTIESVDEEVLALAKASRIPAIHPLFEQERRGRSLSDIVPLAKGMKSMLPKRSKKGAVALEIDDEGENEDQMLHMKLNKRKLSSPLFKVALIVILACVVVFGAIFIINRSFARAEIAVHFKKIPWDYEGTLVAGTWVNTIDAKDVAIPAQLFTETKTITQFFSASARAETSDKATGNITIYNAYSSEPQTLVATTRFVTPNGLIFRLNNKITVPGAQIKDGKIIPSSIEAAITADKAGPTYNVSAIPRLTIPGFKGTPKYEGFYGAIESQTSGGFIGEHAVPTPQDIASAKNETTNMLRATFENSFLRMKPQEFTLIDGASDFQVTKLTVNTAVNTDGKFSVFGEAAFRSLAIRESDIRTLLLQLVGQQYQAKQFESLTLSYKNIKPNFDKKQLTLSLKADGVLTSIFDQEKFKENIAGLEEAKASSEIRNLPDLTDGKVSLWPFWLRRVPQNVEQIHLTVQ